jgi:hypothetical protein
LDEDWSSLSSESSTDTVDMVLETTVRYGNVIYHCFFDPSIDFMAPPLIVGDLDESSCISQLYSKSKKQLMLCFLVLLFQFKAFPVLKFWWNSTKRCSAKKIVGKLTEK